MEWVDPVFCCGHWVPEMVRIAGGRDELGREVAVFKLDAGTSCAAAPERAEPAIVPADPDPSRRRAPPPRLAGELRRLLQEIDAG